MEDENQRNLKLFSEAAKEIMWLTNNIHDILDKIVPTFRETDSIQENVAAIRSKITEINSVNMEKLFGLPRQTEFFTSEVETPKKGDGKCSY